MIVLEKNEYIKICISTYLCYVEKYGTEDYYYMVGRPFRLRWEEEEDCIFPELTIWGYGKTAEEALFMATKNLSLEAFSSFSIETLKEFSIEDFVKKYNEFKEIFQTPLPEDEIVCSVNERVPNGNEKMSVLVQNGKAYPITG